MADLGVGVVGCGGLACNVHLRVLRRLTGARVVAVADPDAAARERARALAPEAYAYASAHELLEHPGLDAVVVASPSPLHAEHAGAVLAAGRHLYLEKPPATEVEAARGLVAAGETAGVVAAVGFNRRFHPLVAAAGAAIAEGRLGALQGAMGSFSEPCDPQGWRATPGGGGPLLDLAIHHVDTFRWLLRDEAAWVDGTITDAGRLAYLRVGFAGGAVAALMASFTNRSDFLVLEGAHGSLEVNRYARRLRLTRPAPGFRARRVRLRPTWEELRWRALALVRPANDPSFGRALEGWIAAIRGERGDLPTLADGLAALEVVAAAAEAAATRRRVELRSAS